MSYMASSLTLSFLLVHCRRPFIIVIIIIIIFQAELFISRVIDAAIIVSVMTTILGESPVQGVVRFVLRDPNHQSICILGLD